MLTEEERKIIADSVNLTIFFSKGSFHATRAFLLETTISFHIGNIPVGRVVIAGIVKVIPSANSIDWGWGSVDIYFY